MLADREAAELLHRNFELGTSDLLEPALVPDPHRTQRRTIHVEGDGPRALRDQPVNHGRARVAEVPLRTNSGIDERGNLLRRREPLFEKGTGEHRHSSEDAAMIMNRRDLTRFPSDEHHFPVFPEKDRVADVLRRVEADAVEVPLRLAREQLDEAVRRRPLGRLAGVSQHFTNRVSEIHIAILMETSPHLHFGQS